MNVEEMVPELFVGHRVYYCQRCLNHRQYAKRKNHRAVCPFGFCNCYACQMVDKRRELNSMLVKVKSDEKSACPIDSHPTPFIPPNSALNSDKDVAKERMPRCQRCAQHNVFNRLKGHKRSCPFLDCHCAKCQVVLERQRLMQTLLMADQIKLRRRQKKQKKAAIEQSERTLQLVSPEQMPFPPFLIPSPMLFNQDLNLTNASERAVQKTPEPNPAAFCLLSILGAQNLLGSRPIFPSVFPPCSPPTILDETTNG